MADQSHDFKSQPDDDEVERQHREQAADDFGAEDYADLRHTPVEPRRWWWQDWVPGDEVSVLASDGGSGKTDLALQMAVGAAYTGQFLGNTVKRTNTLFMSAEDPKRELHFRLNRIMQGQRVQQGNRLHLWSAVRDDVDDPVDPTLFKVTKEGVIVRTDLFGQLEAFVVARKIGLLTIDALGDVNAVGEGDRHGTMTLYRFLRHLAHKHNVAVVPLVHPSLSGMSDGRGYSGNTGHNAGPKGRLYLTKPNSKDAGDPTRVLQLMKSNRSAAGAKINLRWVDGRYEVETQDAADIAQRKAEAKAVFMSLMRTYTLRNFALSPLNTAPSTYAPRVFAKDDAAKDLRLTKAELERAMLSLIDEGVLLNAVEGPPSKQRNRLRIAEDRA